MFSQHNVVAKSSQDPGAIARSVRDQLEAKRGRLAEVLSIILAEFLVVYRAVQTPPTSTREIVENAALAAAVGVLAYYIGSLVERVYRCWHTEPRAIRDAFADALRSQATVAPQVLVRCSSGSLLLKQWADGPQLPLWMLWDVMIVNLSNHPVSLTFQLDADVRRPDGTFSRTRGSQDNGRRYIVELVPDPRLMGPVDVAPHTSVFGNLGFFLGVGCPEENPADPKQMLLCLSDAVSQRSGRVRAYGQGICSLESAELPHHTEDD